MGMHGMLDHQSRVAYARDRAETLRDAMLASQRRKADDDAGRPTPARAPLAARPARLRIHRGASST
jgi:hypothetical protein